MKPRLIKHFALRLSSNCEPHCERFEFCPGSDGQIEPRGLQDSRSADEVITREAFATARKSAYLIRYVQGRVEEAPALLLHSLLLAQENDLPGREIRAHDNLAAMLINRFQNREALEHIEQAAAIAGRLGGSRSDGWLVLGIKPLVLYQLGLWDDALTAAEEMTAEEVGGPLLSGRIGRRGAAWCCWRAARSSIGPPPTSTESTTSRSSTPSTGR